MRSKVTDLVEVELHALDHVFLESVFNLGFGLIRVFLFETFFDTTQELQGASVLEVWPKHH